MDYRKLNATTKKDHFPLSFIDQMLDRLAGNDYFCFLDGYSGYNQIIIAIEDQKKKTFTYPYGSFAFQPMPFGLSNAPGTFQRCMMSIFFEFLEEPVEIFMDDFSIFGNLFECLSSKLGKSFEMMWGHQLGFKLRKMSFCGKGRHKISKKGLEVNQAKIETMEKLSPPTDI